MVRRLLRFVMLGLVLGALVGVPEVLLAAPVNSIGFVNVSPTSCVPSTNNSIRINITISVAPNDNHRVDNWTLTNLRTRTSMFANASPAVNVSSKGESNVPGYMWMAVPAKTQQGDRLNINVQMVSTFGKKTIIESTSATFNCSTGQFMTSSLSASDSGIALRFTDGRLNQQPEQSVAVYPDSAGGFAFWAVNKGVGSFALDITKAQLDANPDNGQPYLIAQNKGVSVYRLVGGLLQVHRSKPDGKDYVFTWAG